MADKEHSYSRVKNVLQRGEFPSITLNLQLKNGDQLKSITPYAIVERYQDNNKILKLFYLDSVRRAHWVNLDGVNGFRVIQGTGEYENKLMVEFTYFKRTNVTDSPESNVRIILVGDLFYGVHANHAKINEEPDFYLTGEDSQYSNQAKDERQRTFPFWRLSVYGSPEEAKSSFIPENKSFF